MLTYIRTSILESKAQTVTNTVNTVGVMGKGLASAMKKRYPEMFHEYVRLCDEHKVRIGRLWLWKTATQWVLNFPTKRNWRNPSKLSYIESGLRKFVAEYERRGIWEIAFPRLGCGNGNLDWDDVRPLMETYLANLPIPVYIHDYEVDIGKPEHLESRRLKHLEFQRSFPQFISDIGTVIHVHRGEFQTIQNRKPFVARTLDGNLKIDRDGRGTIVSNDELFELWSLLLRGPVTRKKMVGRASEEAYYIFPILQALPYIRVIELQPRGSSMPSVAVELDDGTKTEESVGVEESQGEFAWL